MLESFGTFLTRMLHEDVYILLHVHVNEYTLHVYTHSVGRSRWSSEGIQVISNVTRGNITTVLCNSTHLTSFAVLVDAAGGLEVCTQQY